MVRRADRREEVTIKFGLPGCTDLVTYEEELTSDVIPRVCMELIEAVYAKYP
jgi:hypothetical protein